ncbi:MAG: hypothetical protein HQL59_12005 [Magnetococcales bacterium]|nr:hypothetical protein [Magnetococcales bacterium]
MSMIYRALKGAGRPAPVVGGGGRPGGAVRGEVGLDDESLLRSGRMWGIVAAGAVLLAGLGGGGYWYLSGQGRGADTAVVVAGKGKAGGKPGGEKAGPGEVARAAGPESLPKAGVDQPPAAGAGGALTAAGEKVSAAAEPTDGGAVAVPTAEEKRRERMEKMAKLQAQLDAAAVATQGGEAAARKGEPKESEGGSVTAAAPGKASGRDAAAVAAKEPPAAPKPEVVAKRQEAPVALGKDAETQNLVTDLGVAISRGEREEVERLLARLEASRGADNIFAMKMKAFWLVQTNDLSQGEALLKVVLARKPDDLEAGVNMAIVEMRSGRESAAHQRVVRLLKRYPGDLRLRDLLKYFQ